MHDFLKLVKDIGFIIVGVFVVIGFVFGVIGVLIHRKRYGSLPKCQGYGRD